MTCTAALPEESSVIKKDRENVLNSGNNYSSYLNERYRWLSWEARAGSLPSCRVGVGKRQPPVVMWLLHHGQMSKLFSDCLYSV